MIDTLPLTKAAETAPSAEERKLCMDLAWSIVQGSESPRRFYESRQAEKVLHNDQLTALATVLRSAKQHFAEQREKRAKWFTPVTSSDPDLTPSKSSHQKRPPTKPKASSSATKKKSTSVKIGGSGPRSKAPESPKLNPPLVCAIMSSQSYEKFLTSRKGKRKTAKSGAGPSGVAGENTNVGVDVDDEADVGVDGPPGMNPKYVLYMETSEGFRKFRVYEDYDSGLDSGPDIPMSPVVSEEADPKKHAFLLMKKRPKESSCVNF